MIEGQDILEKYCKEKEVDTDKISDELWEKMVDYIDMMLNSAMGDINEDIYEKFKDEAWLTLHNNEIEMKGED